LVAFISICLQAIIQRPEGKNSSLLTFRWCSTRPIQRP